MAVFDVRWFDNQLLPKKANPMANLFILADVSYDEKKLTRTMKLSSDFFFLSPVNSGNCMFNMGIWYIDKQL